MLNKRDIYMFSNCKNLETENLNKYYLPSTSHISPCSLLILYLYATSSHVSDILKDALCNDL